MKWMKLMLAGVLLCSTLPAAANEARAEMLEDYAFGKPLESGEAATWYRVELPHVVYQQSTWPDLRDVRVFNQQGDVVPFSLVAQQAPVPQSEPLALRMFPLDASPIAEKTDEDDEQQSVMLRTKGGIEIRLKGEKSAAIGQSYLLALPESFKGTLFAEQLQFEWKNNSASWQGKASVYYSEDMKRWHLVQRVAPLMDLSSGEDRLKIDRVAANIRLSEEGMRYLLVIFDEARLPITLTGVNVIKEMPSAQSKQIVVQGQGKRVSDSEAIWEWEQPQPLTSLSVALEDGGTLPVMLEWRAAQEGEWRPLKKELLYWVNGQRSGDIALGGHPVEAVRMTTLNARLPETIPTVSGSRDSQLVVFNTQGKGPYMLVWGNRAAKPGAVALDMLIPESLRGERGLEQFPWAEPMASVTLGGEARLMATTQAEKQSVWQRVLVWGVLIIGVLALLGMALRIWREVKNGGPEA